jgi:NADH-quinone oxidoreductase subunit K
MSLIGTNVGLIHFLVVSALLFSIGICGIITNRRNIISILISIELILLSVNINFVAFSVSLRGLTGQIFTILILTVAAAEAAVGLAILISYHRTKGNIEAAEMNEMQG